MIDVLDRYAEMVRGIALGSGPWMAFNSTLATLPAVLAVALFHHPRRQGPGWWAGVAAFVLFLPNAPYVITDLVHLRGMLEAFPGSRASGVVPAGALALLVVWGVGAYALCLAEVDRGLARSSWSRRRLAVRTGLHLLCAFGVVLGRFPRLHSWHVVTRPAATVDGIVGVLHPLAVPLVLALAVAFALAAAAFTAVARAAWDRSVEVGGTARAVLQAARSGLRPS